MVGRVFTTRAHLLAAAIAESGSSDCGVLNITATDGKVLAACRLLSVLMWSHVLQSWHTLAVSIPSLPAISHDNQPKSGNVFAGNDK